MSHRRRRLTLGALAALLVLAPPAAGKDPGRWKLAQADPVNLNYFQGMTHGPNGNVLFIGVFEGVWRTDLALHQLAGVADFYPDDVAAIGFNHAGDPTYDPSEGGRLLAPMECYHPDQTQANTCGLGGFGVIDPKTLAWRYWVRLDQADIPKAMWAEVSPDHKLVWTSSGNDLLAYSTADISAAHAATGAESPPIHPVKRLPGAVPPSGVTGAVFVGGRLLLAGDVDGLLQIRSVDLTGKTPTRTELELPGVSAESEGLDLIDMRGGTLHWLLSSIVDHPTYGSGHNELLTFLPTASSRLVIAVSHSVVTVTSRFAGKSHPVAGATVTVGSSHKTTDTHGRARFAHIGSGALVRAVKLSLKGQARA